MLKFLIGAVLGLAAGWGSMLIFFPYIFPPAVVNETVADMTVRDPRVFFRGTFREDSPGQDLAHWGRGGFSVYRDADEAIILELQADFEVGPGPNFWIYLNTTTGIEDEEDFQGDRERHRLAKLKSFTGSQVYRIPKAEWEKARAITIWCDTFNEYIASADLGSLTSGDS